MATTFHLPACFVLDTEIAALQDWVRNIKLADELNPGLSNTDWNMYNIMSMIVKFHSID